MYTSLWYQLLKKCLIEFQSNQQSFVMLVFNPAKMIATQTDELHKKAESLLTKFINLNSLTPTACDQISKEYKYFLRNDIVFSVRSFQIMINRKIDLIPFDSHCLQLRNM